MLFSLWVLFLPLPPVAHLAELTQPMLLPFRRSAVRRLPLTIPSHGLWIKLIDELTDDLE